MSLPRTLNVKPTAAARLAICDFKGGKITLEFPTASDQQPQVWAAISDLLVGAGMFNMMFSPKANVHKEMIRKLKQCVEIGIPITTPIVIHVSRDMPENVMRQVRDFFLRNILTIADSISVVS